MTAHWGVEDPAAFVGPPARLQPRLPRARREDPDLHEPSARGSR